MSKIRARIHVAVSSKEDFIKAMKCIIKEFKYWSFREDNNINQLGGLGKEYNWDYDISSDKCIVPPFVFEFIRNNNIGEAINEQK